MHYSVRQNTTYTTGAESGSRGRAALWLAAGAALAASGLLVRQRTRQAEREHPPRGEFIDIGGVRLHYIERGEGQPLVILHGDGSMIEDVVSSGLVDMAAKNHRVIVFDRPGYGYSERPRSKLWTPQKQAELLQRALLYLGAEKPIIVGHSWGTLVALSMALDFPTYVKGLVLIAGYYYPTARADVPVMAVPAIPVVGDLIRYTLSPWLARMAWPALMRRVFGPAPTPERFAAEFPVWLALRPSQLRAAAAETAMLIPSAFSLRDRYHELTLPVAIMAGNGDRHVDLHRHSERLHRELPQSTLEVADGVGHMLHHCAQQEVMEAIARVERDADGAPHREMVAETSRVPRSEPQSSSLLH